jgi:hypothetical protein
MNGAVMNADETNMEYTKPSHKMIGKVDNPTISGALMESLFTSASQGTDSLHAIIRRYRWAFARYSKSVARHNLVHIVGYAQRKILP